MKKLYQKNEILFAVSCIVLYVVGSSYADQMPVIAELSKSTTVVFQVVLSALLIIFIRNNDLNEKYGFCSTGIPARTFLWYLPFVLLATVNIWFGVSLNHPLTETIVYMVSMVLSGFLEEVIFRGLLFRAMSRDNVKSAIIVSSLTFGIGHIVNLFNGSGESLVEGLCQVCYAVAIGFLFVILFHRGKSLWPCIITHSVFNALSGVSNEALTEQYLIPVSIALMVISLGYALYLIHALPKAEEIS